MSSQNAFVHACDYVKMVVRAKAEALGLSDEAQDQLTTLLCKVCFMLAGLRTAITNGTIDDMQLQRFSRLLYNASMDNSLVPDWIVVCCCAGIDDVDISVALSKEQTQIWKHLNSKLALD